MARRRFLQVLGAASVTTATATAAPGNGSNGVDFDPETEVPRVHGFEHTNHDAIVDEGATPRRRPIIGVISREKWRVVEAADRARERVKRALTDLNPTPDVMVRLPDGADDTAPRSIVVKHTTDVAGKRGERAVVSEPEYTLDELSDLVKDRFPDTLQERPETETHPASPLERVPTANGVSAVDGMPIETERAEIGRSTHNNGGSHYEYDYHSPGVPAGCYIESDFTPNGPPGTLGTPASCDFTGSKLFVTAGHLLGSASSVGNNVYQDSNDDNGDLLGSIIDNSLRPVKVDPGFDAGAIGSLEFDQHYRFASDFGANSYKIDTIRGIRTKQWLMDNQGVFLSKQGIAHPHETGQIGDWGDTYYESDHPEAGGDSGGPHWHTVNIDEAYIAGIHRGQSLNFANGQSSRATLMEAIENQYFLTV